jgi:large subunit ribosomal protein L15
MKLHNLSNIKGATHPRKRLGCGVGSGHGKTSGKGHKGQRARSGGTVRTVFEGGQTPLFRRLPQRGFSNHKFRKHFAVINLSDLEKLGLPEVDRDVLVAQGLVRRQDPMLKVLGTGEITKAVKLTAHAISASAKAKIEAAGGSVTLIEKYVPSEEASS